MSERESERESRREKQCNSNTKNRFLVNPDSEPALSVEKHKLERQANLVQCLDKEEKREGEMRQRDCKRTQANLAYRSS